MPVRWGLMVLAGLMVSGLAWGDVVVNSQGRRFEGQIVRESAGQVTIRLNTGAEVTLQRDLVQSIERSAQWQNLMTLGDHLRDRQEYEAAASQYEQALQAEPPEGQAEVIRQRLAEVQQAMTQVLGAARERDVDAVSDLIERAAQELREDSLQEALASLDEADQLRPTDAQAERIRQLRVDTLYRRAYSRFDRLDETGALEALDELFAVDPTHNEGLNLYRRIIEDRPLDSPEVVAEIEALVASNPDRLDLQARLGEHYGRQRDWDRALPHLEAAAQSELHFTQVRSRLRQAMVEMVNRATGEGDYDRAIELYDQLLRRFPGEDENYLNVLIYYREERRLADDDLDGHIALAEQCLANGYDTWAREQMEHVLERDPNHPGALAMHRQFAERAIQEAVESLTEGNVAVARMQFERFIQDYNYPDLAEQAQLRLADVQRQMREAERNRAQQAEMLVAQGDSYYETALRNREMWMEREYNPRQNYIAIRGLTPRDTTVRYFRRAILCYEAALELDPSLGPLEGGGLNLKIADAQQGLSEIEQRRLPRREPQFSRR